MRRGAFLPVAALILCPVAALAQTTGGIAGWVSDSSGAPLPTSPSKRSGRASRDNGPRSPPKTAPTGYRRCRPDATSFARACRDSRASREAIAVARRRDRDGSDHPPARVARERLRFRRPPFVDTTSTTIGTTYNDRVTIHLPLDRNYADVARDNPGVVEDRRRQAGPIAVARGGRRHVRGESVDHRRHQHDERLQGRAGKGGQQRVRRGSTGHDRRISGGVWAIARRHHQCRHEVGRQRVPWRTRSSTTTPRAFGRDRSSPRNPIPRSAECGSPTTHRTDYGFDLGGYLLRDRLWFFGAYNRDRPSRDACRATSRASSSRRPCSFRSTGRTSSIPPS